MEDSKGGGQHAKYCKQYEINVQLTLTPEPRSTPPTQPRGVALEHFSPKQAFGAAEASFVDAAHAEAPLVSPQPAAEAPLVSPQPAAEAPLVSPQPAAEAPSVSPHPAADAPSVSPQRAAEAPFV